MTNGFGLQNVPGFGKVGAQVTGVEKLEHFIRELSRSSGKVGPVLRLIGGMMKKEIKSHFPKRKGERGVSSDGKPWPELSEMTKAMRRKGRKKHQRLEPLALRDTGDLYGSINYKVQGNVVYVGTNKDYAADQNFGTDTIPAREFMWIGDSKVEEIYNRLVNDLIGALFNK